MKELLSFLASKTQALVGQKFVAHYDRGSSSQVVQTKLDMLTDAFHNVGDDNIPQLAASLASMKVTDRIVVTESSFYAAMCLDISRPLEFSRVALLAELVPDHIASLGLGVGHVMSALQVDADITQALSEHYLGWMAMDAYGMHEGYFRWFDSVHKMKMPEGLPPLAQEAFDQGLGRGLWFIAGGDSDTILNLVNSFPIARRFSMWRGIGLNVGFWGAFDEKQIRQLYKASGKFLPYFQQGVVQAVAMRCDIDEVEDHTRAGSEIVCGAPIHEISELAHTLMQKVPGGPAESRTFFGWQNEIVDFFSGTFSPHSKILNT